LWLDKRETLIKTDVQQIFEKFTQDSSVTSTTQGDGSKIGQPVATTSVSNIGDTDDALGKCPISYTQNDVSTSTVIAMDVNTKIWSSTVHDESNSSQTYLDPEFAKIPLANWISTSVSDVALIQVQSNIDGSIKSGSITSTGHTTVEAKQTNGENATVKMKFSSIQTSGHASEKVLMKFTGLNGIAPVVLGIFKTDKSDPEIILNGEMYSAERLKKDTGIDVSSDGNIK